MIIYISYNHIQIHTNTYIYIHIQLLPPPPPPTPQGGGGTGALLYRPITMGWGWGGVPRDADPYIRIRTYIYIYNICIFNLLTKTNFHLSKPSTFDPVSVIRGWRGLANIFPQKMARSPKFYEEEAMLLRWRTGRLKVNNSWTR